MSFVRTPRQEFFQLNQSKVPNTPSNTTSPSHGNDIYLNIEMSPIFSPSQGTSLKNFNRKLKHSLKERQIQKAAQVSNPQVVNKVHKIYSLIRNQQPEDNKNLLKQKIAKNHTKTQFSPLKKKKDWHKKFSLDMRSNVQQQKSVLSFPLIKDDFNGSGNIFDRLITSESSKGLIERLLKRRKGGNQEEKGISPFRYPFNRKIFSKMNSKSQTIKCSSLVDFPAANNGQRNIEASIKQSNCKRLSLKDNFNLILSPTKRKQQLLASSLPKHTQRKIIQPVKPAKLSICGEEELSPWNMDSHPSLDY